MSKIIKFKEISFNKFDILGIVYLFFMINQGISIEILNIGRLKILEIIPLFLLIIVGLKNFNFILIKTIKYIYVSLFFLFIFSLIAAFWQETFKPTLYITGFIILIVSCLNFSNNEQIQDADIFKLFKYILVVNFLILISCLFFGDTKYLQVDELYRFRGIFGNSNQLGRFCSISIILSLFPLFEAYFKISKTFKFICSFNLLLSIIFLLSSNSRLSLLLILIAIFSYTFLNFPSIIYKIDDLLKNNVFIKIILAIILISLLYTFFLVTKSSWLAISNKFISSEILEARGGLSSFRFEYIKSSLAYLNYFGYENFKNETSICAEVLNHYHTIKQYLKCDVHNTYLNVWLKFGFYLALFLFYGLFLILIFSLNFYDKSQKYIFVSKFIIVLTISLMVYYFFETGIFHIFLIFDLILISYLIKRKKLIETN